MIDLVTSIRDISDSLPALSSGTPGSVVESEPDLAVFTRDAQEVRQARDRFRLGNRRPRFPWLGGAASAPARAMHQFFHGPLGYRRLPAGLFSDDSDSSDYGVYHHNPFDSDDDSDYD
jgi:hypothetical protein